MLTWHAWSACHVWYKALGYGGDLSSKSWRLQPSARHPLTCSVFNANLNDPKILSTTGCTQQRSSGKGDLKEMGGLVGTGHATAMLPPDRMTMSGRGRDQSMVQFTALHPLAAMKKSKDLGHVERQSMTPVPNLHLHCPRGAPTEAFEVPACRKV